MTDDTSKQQDSEFDRGWGQGFIVGAVFATVLGTLIELGRALW
jgi:hypothetical protein